MKKKTSRKKTDKSDVNLMAFNARHMIEAQPAEKNPHAVALGRLGGLRGGKARAQSLSPQKRKEIAIKAARTRWKNK